jgi:CRP-like cAMP-binding protein
MGKRLPANPKNVKFADLLQICTKYFGKPRISGSHHIFKMPWQGDPRINIQKDGNMAKEYQVKNVVKAIKKLENEPQKQIGQNKAKEKKHEKE